MAESQVCNFQALKDKPVRVVALRSSADHIVMSSIGMFIAVDLHISTHSARDGGPLP